ncbi:MAG: phosphate acyltransferase PlsX [Anaerolineales bacterium]|nr:MAG: phosphate acyltransferase PlsX [Anaerolineales bacterium]
MRIVLDAMGSDTHPTPEVQAALEAFQRWGEPITLTGPENELNRLVKELGGEPQQVEIVHAPEVLEMTDKPAAAARGKSQNSMAVGMDLLKEGKVDAFVTAGNTGGAMATALFRLGRIRGVKRPGLAAVIPVQNGQAIVIDIGANTDCRPEYLLQFANMGSTYAELVFSKPNPRVGLLSNGEEAGKGNNLVKETYPMLVKSGLNFIGNVEPKEVFAGNVDVVVTDGFYGNVFIKTSETVARFLLEQIRAEIRASTVSSLGALLAKPAFQRVREMLDPAEYGAAPLLGVNGLVFIGHGRSESKALVSAIRVARQAVSENVLSAMQAAQRGRLDTE